MGYAFSSLDELGEGYGFRKIRKPLGVTAFGEPYEEIGRASCRERVSECV